LLLLVSGVGVGYAIVNPAVLSPLLSRLKLDSESATDAATTETVAGGNVSDNPDFRPPGPDLSTREFVELDLESLSTLDVDGQGSLPSTASTPTITPLPNSGTTLPAPNATPQPSPSPTSTTTAPITPSSISPTATTAPPAVSGISPTATGNNYYVIMDYTGDASLAQARTVVGDAFVRNYQEGSRIQLGAFDNATSAQQFLQELQAQGLTGRLYGPTDE
jgi:hypothetical protein